MCLFCILRCYSSRCVILPTRERFHIDVTTSYSLFWIMPICSFVQVRKPIIPKIPRTNQGVSTIIQATKECCPNIRNTILVFISMCNNIISNPSGKFPDGFRESNLRNFLYYNGSAIASFPPIGKVHHKSSKSQYHCYSSIFQF